MELTHDEVAAATTGQLTRAELLALAGLQHRAALLTRELQDDERALVAEIEARLGLAAGSIGTTHALAGEAVVATEKKEDDDGGETMSQVRQAGESLPLRQEEVG